MIAYIQRVLFIDPHKGAQDHLSKTGWLMLCFVTRFLLFLALDFLSIFKPYYFQSVTAAPRIMVDYWFLLVQLWRFLYNFTDVFLVLALSCPAFY
jgi:hypothetical protein